MDRSGEVSSSPQAARSAAPRWQRPPALATAHSEVALLTTYVAGTAYNQAARPAETLRAGDRLMLRREPRNDYDPRAIQVHSRSGAKLGYLPRVDNQALARLMDAGLEVTARIRAITPDIRLDVFLTV